MGDLGWLTALGQGSPWVLVIGVLLFGWRRDAKRADRLEQSLHTALRAVDQLTDSVTTIVSTTERIASAVDGWDTIAGRHRHRDGSGG